MCSKGDSRKTESNGVKPRSYFLSPSLILWQIPPPDGKPSMVGLEVLDEPSARQSDATVLDLQLRALAKHTTAKSMVRRFCIRKRVMLKHSALIVNNDIDYNTCLVKPLLVYNLLSM